MIDTRELLFGALLLIAKTPETRRAAILASAAVDALDFAATVWGWEMGEVRILLSYSQTYICLLPLITDQCIIPYFRISMAVAARKECPDQ